MTDQIPAGLTRAEAQAVREWAERAHAAEVQDRTVAHAARVLLAVLPPPVTTAKENPEMTDQTLDDQVRPIVAAMRAAMRRDEHAYPEAKFLADLSGYVKDLEALLPPRPTLADMTAEERRECRRMQCDVKGEASTVVIIQVFIRQETARLMWPNGWTEVRRFDEVTPRPDLPRMTWPGEQQPAPALPDGWRLADHPEYGRVIVTSAAPDTDGYVYFVSRATGPIGNDWHLCPPAELTYIDTEPEANQ